MRIIKYIVLLFSLTAFSNTTKAQDDGSYVDSLKLALKNTKQDSTRIKLRYQIGAAAEIFRIGYWDSLITDINSIKKSKPKQTVFYSGYLASSLNNLGYIHKDNGNLVRSKACYSKSIAVREELLKLLVNPTEQKDQKQEIAWTFNNLAFVFELMGDFHAAVEAQLKSLSVYIEINDSEGASMCYNNLGSKFSAMGDIPKGLEYYYKALKIEEQNNDKHAMAVCMSNLGILYQMQGNKDKGIELFNKALKLHEELKDKKGIASVLHNIAGIMDDQGDGSEALPYYLKSLKLKEETHDKPSAAYTLNNLGTIYCKQNKFDEGINYFKKSLAIREAINDAQGTSFTLAYLADAYSKTNKDKLAMELGLKSLQISREIKIPVNLKTSAAALKSIYKKAGQFSKALEMYELEIQMSDSIMNLTTKKASIKKQFQYQYEKKAAADSVKNAEEQKVKNAQLFAQQAQLKQEKTQRFALYGGLLLVIAFSGFVYNRFKITQKQKVIIEAQKHQVDKAYEQLHEKNKEIIDSILYARRIQHALLTPQKTIARELARLTSNKA